MQIREIIYILFLFTALLLVQCKSGDNCPPEYRGKGYISASEYIPARSGVTVVTTIDINGNAVLSYVPNDHPEQFIFYIENTYCMTVEKMRVDVVTYSRFRDSIGMWFEYDQANH